MSEPELDFAYTPLAETSDLHVYFTHLPRRDEDDFLADVEPDACDLDAALMQMGISWPIDEPFAEGFHMIQANKIQLEELKEKFRAFGYWMIFAADAANSITLKGAPRLKARPGPERRRSF